MLTESITYLLLTSLPYRLLSYYPFKQSLRFSWKTTLVVIFLTEAIVLVLAGPAQSIGISLPIYKYVLVTVCIVVYFSMILESWSKLAFFYLFIVNYIILVQSIALLIARLILGEVSITSINYNVIALIIFLLLLPVSMRFMKSLANRMARVDAPQLWRRIWLLPCLTTVIVLIFTSNFTNTNVLSWSFIIARLCFIICFMVVYSMLLSSLDRLQEEAALKERIHVSDQIAALNKAQYQQLTEHIEATRRARHDLRQYLLVIQSYIEKNDKETLKTYIEEYQKTLPSAASPIYCKNYAVNAIIHYYIEQAEANGIHTDVTVALPDPLPIAETDFCVLLGNLLENAVEACHQHTGTSPSIRLRTQSLGDDLAITLDNTCDKAPTPSSDAVFLSTKHTGNGTGTLSVKNIVDACGGTVHFNYHEHVFYVSVFLPANKEGES